MALLLVKNSDLTHIFDLVFPEQVSLFSNLFQSRVKKIFYVGRHLPVHLSAVTPPGQGEEPTVHLVLRRGRSLIGKCNKR